MLVLSRHTSEQVRIGDGIELTVVAVSGGQVRIGIKAPRSVRILRAELPPIPDAAGEANPLGG